jgi:hypothetical protein
MSNDEHGVNCGGCRELMFLTERDQARIRRDQLQRAVDAVRQLCDEGWAFEDSHPISGGKGQKVVSVEDVLRILDHLLVPAHR